MKHYHKIQCCFCSEDAIIFYKRIGKSYIFPVCYNDSINFFERKRDITNFIKLSREQAASIINMNEALE